MPRALPSFSVQVFCLCAAWCNACREYEAVFRTVQAPFIANDAVDFAWLDIEDCADWLDPVDIEDFPTLLVAQNWKAVFLGPLMPQLQTLERMLDYFMQEAAPRPPLEKDAQALLERVRTGLEPQKRLK